MTKMLFLHSFSDYSSFFHESSRFLKVFFFSKIVFLLTISLGEILLFLWLNRKLIILSFQNPNAIFNTFLFFTITISLSINCHFLLLSSFLNPAWKFRAKTPIFEISISVLYCTLGIGCTWLNPLWILFLF